MICTNCRENRFVKIDNENYCLSCGHKYVAPAKSAPLEPATTQLQVTTDSKPAAKASKSAAPSRPTSADANIKTMDGVTSQAGSPAPKPKAAPVTAQTISTASATAPAATTVPTKPKLQPASLRQALSLGAKPAFYWYSFWPVLVGLTILTVGWTGFSTRSVDANWLLAQSKPTVLTIISLGAISALGLTLLFLTAQGYVILASSKQADGRTPAPDDWFTVSLNSIWPLAASTVSLIIVTGAGLMAGFFSYQKILILEPASTWHTPLLTAFITTGLYWVMTLAFARNLAVRLIVIGRRNWGTALISGCSLALRNPMPALSNWLVQIVTRFLVVFSLVAIGLWLLQQPLSLHTGLATLATWGLSGLGLTIMAGYLLSVAWIYATLSYRALVQHHNAAQIELYLNAAKPEPINWARLTLVPITTIILATGLFYLVLTYPALGKF